MTENTVAPVALVADDSYNLPQSVEFSVFTSDKSQSKTISLQDGALRKEYSSPMARGAVTKKSVDDLQAVADLQNAVKANEVFCNGIVIGSKTDESVTVVTKNNLDVNQGAVARTSQFFTWPNGLALFSIDIDKHPSLTVEECKTELFKAVPQLIDTDHIERPSCSSYIKNGDEYITRLNGLHLTYVVESSKLEAIVEYIENRLWLTGHGYVSITKVGSLLCKTLVDTTIYQPCRLEFLAPARCVAPLEQDEIKSAVIRSKTRILFQDGLECLTDSEKAAVKQLKQAAKDKLAVSAENQRKAFIQSRLEACNDIQRRKHLQQSLEEATVAQVLPDDWCLYVYDEGSKPTQYSVKEIKADPDKFNDLKTADPFEPSYKNGAITGWLNLKEGRANLYDFHSGICFNLGEVSNDASSWNEPVKFKEAAGEHYPFPVDKMPAVMKEAVIEVAKNNQVDEALVAVSAISAASLGCQMLANVSRKPFVNEPGPIAVFTLVKADSGERKSRIDQLIYKPYHDFVNLKRQCYNTEIEGYKSAYGLWKIEYDAASQTLTSLIKRQSDPKKGGQISDADISLARTRFEEIVSKEPVKPVEYELFVSDFTSEKLVEMLAQARNIGVVCDEGGRVFSSYSFSKDHVTKTASDLNSLWAGSPFSVKRKQAESFDLDGTARVLMAIMCQPKVVNQFIARNSVAVGDSGFLPRFLICEPKSTQGTRFITEVTEHSDDKLNALRSIFSRFIQATDDLLKGNKEPVVLCFSKEAIPAWVNYYNKVEKATNDEYSSIKAFASKAAEQVARIAGIYHIVDNVGRLGSLPLEISLENVNRAIASVDWFMNEALIIMGTADSSWRYSRVSGALDRMIRYCVNHETDHMAKGALAGLLKVDVKEYNQYLQLLELQDCIKVEHDKKGKGITIWLNPVLLNEKKKNDQNRIVDLPAFSMPKSASNASDLGSTPVTEQNLVSATADGRPATIPKSAIN